jgi:hypothetical protein
MRSEENDLSFAEFGDIKRPDKASMEKTESEESASKLK